MRVTVAGVMATWCYDAEDANGLCSPAIVSSLIRALLYSLGSVAFGSLVEGVAEAVNAMVNIGKKYADSDGNTQDIGSRIFGFLSCCTLCCAKSIEYFNQWAYVYIGVYGYSYQESGRRVMELFKERGWTSMVSDILVSYVLNFTSVLVAAATGGIAVVLDSGGIGLDGVWDSFA